MTKQIVAGIGIFAVIVLPYFLLLEVWDVLAKIYVGIAVLTAVKVAFGRLFFWGFQEDALKAEQNRLLSDIQKAYNPGPSGDENKS